ncbi:PD-(D/E)XK nuclease family protein [Paraoerskovia marina]|uniref:PD-(D/E)XK nuclease family protein n=1 Tax=Paraoerskovia marina TaxID=545619 RepID=UPI000492D880|nr:PD-(D/E)XK nuclease family protein [Paraoerskovia marina]
MIELRPPEELPDAVVLDDSQAGVIEALGEHPVVMAVGAPGSGRTTVAVHAVLAAIEAGTEPSDILVISASRRSAGRLRDVIGARAGRTTSVPMVRTAAAAAFAILGTRAAALGDPAPTLITGPEQDLLLTELLAGYLEDVQAGRRDELPGGLPAETLVLRGFRQELRDLLMRAAERGVDAVRLDELGREHGREEWRLAAQLYQEYLDVSALRALTLDSGPRYDPARVVEEATEALEDWDENALRVARPSWRLIVVDDYQESTAATARFLRELHDDGARLLLLADPDIAVQTFRGAVPSLVGRAGAPPAPAGRPFGGELGARTLTLSTAWRQPEPLRAVTRAVTQRVGVVGGAQHRAAAPAPAPAPAPGSAPSGARVAVLPSAADEIAHVARVLRAEHLLHGTPWDRMAVVSPSGAQLAAVRRGLIAASVPVATVGTDVPLHDEPAVAPLLELVRVACALAADPEDAVLDAETAASLLVSPLGGSDVVALRRLRRALRAEELAGGGGRTSDALLVEVLHDPARAATLPSSVRRPAAAVAHALAATRAAAEDPDADAQSVLWAAWDAAGLAERWRATALAGGPGGARADRDLDAVLGVFRAAESFVDRMPGSRPEAFVTYLRSQDIPADSLAASAADGSAVAALTPAGAAGSEWDVVVVTGVQDGTWPDLRLRDSLLGSQALADLLAGRSGDARGHGREARRAVLDDELRSFALAVSRARRRLVVTAVEDADDSPSMFCDLVDGGPAPDDEEDADQRSVAPAVPLDLRGVVARARSVLVSDDPRRDEAAGLLADLADAGVGHADPDQWYGVHPTSSDEPLWGPEDKVRVSPSKVESVNRCALRWALEAGGGTAPDATAQSLGTLVHSISHDLPKGAHHELAAELDRRWPELALPEGWPATQARRHADGMIESLAGYVAASGEPILLEAEFQVDVGRAVLRGVADRIEKVGRPDPDTAADADDAGPSAVLVADLKTGKMIQSRAEAVENPQLGTYQLAVEAGAFDLPEGTTSAGAQLAYLAAGRKVTLRSQPALRPDSDGGSWARTVVEGVADTMAASAFTARTNSMCRVCPVRRACPAQPDGQQVIE